MVHVKTTQIVGLIAVVVFGGIFALTFLLPERDPAKSAGAAPMRDLSSPAPRTSPSAAPRDSTAAGSADAQDDLYCQGLIHAAHRAETDPTNPADRRRILMAAALASTGADRLIREGVATRETTAIFADAYADIAMKDFARSKPRISLPACEARAEAALKALSQ